MRKQIIYLVVRERPEWCDPMTAYVEYQDAIDERLRLLKTKENARDFKERFSTYNIKTIDCHAQ